MTTHIGGGTYNSVEEYGGICTGYANQAGQWSFVGSGSYNWAHAQYSAIPGGSTNTINESPLNGGKHFIGAGSQNRISELDATIHTKSCAILCGQANIIENDVDSTAEVRFSSILGGHNNVMTAAEFCTLGGGQHNIMTYASLTGGIKHSVLGGGLSNSASSHRVVLAGGTGNILHSDCDDSVIGGGDTNEVGALANAKWAVVGGGRQNNCSAFYSVISGGFLNAIIGEAAFIGGGYSNEAQAVESCVVGGKNNVASATDSFVGGGETNTASGDYSAVVGGKDNEPSGDYTFLGSGSENTVEGDYSVVAGGAENAAAGDHAAVGGGQANNASAEYSAVAGGHSNSADGDASFVGGGEGNEAAGDYSSVVGGLENEATPDYSVSSGRRALANHYCERVHGNAASAGDVQESTILLAGQSTTDSWVTAHLESTEAEVITMPQNSAWGLTYEAVGRKSDGSECAFIRYGACTRRTTGDATVADSEEISKYSDAGLSTSDIQLVADGSELEFQAKGPADTVIDWVFKVNIVQVK